jgi:hypothetical protein
MTDLPRPAKSPCKSCPYRKDVPSGIWAPEEYVKLLSYDGEIMDQMMQGGHALFMCHQNDGCLCAGWVGTHGAEELVALRLHPVAPETFEFVSPVPLFASGAEAAAHGMRDIENPGTKAQKVMDRLLRKRGDLK